MPGRRGPDDLDGFPRGTTGEHTPPRGLPRVSPTASSPDWATQPGHSIHAEADPGDMLELDLEPDPEPPPAMEGTFAPPPAPRFATPVHPFAAPLPELTPPGQPFPPAEPQLLASFPPLFEDPPSLPASAHPAGSAARYTVAGPIATTDWRATVGPRLGRVVRACATIALLTTVGTYVAARVDFLRRHQPGITPEIYWVPQLKQIWAPGLIVALLFALTAAVVHHWQARMARRQ